ncbi:hypothetical protein ACFLTZ_02420 [Chloroflexota bacterium]
MTPAEKAGIETPFKDWVDLVRGSKSEMSSAKRKHRTQGEFSTGADVLSDNTTQAFSLYIAKSNSTAACQFTGVTTGTCDITAVSEHTLMNVRLWAPFLKEMPTETIKLTSMISVYWRYPS